MTGFGTSCDSLSRTMTRTGTRTWASTASTSSSGAAGLPVTFHRAFEDLTDPVSALAALGRHPAVDRILCDGGAGDWTARAERLGAWSDVLAPGLTILAGGGVTDEALEALARVRPLTEIHVGRLVREPATVEGRVSVLRVAAVVARLRDLRP